MSALLKHKITKALVVCATLLQFSVPSYAEITVIVHPDSPIGKLSDLELKRIFLGRLGRWPNTERDIKVIDIPSESLLYQQFYGEIINFLRLIILSVTGQLSCSAARALYLRC
jgi:hypothetical protein